MAGPMTHMLVSQAASDPGRTANLDDALQQILARWQPFLLLGSVGPDLPAIVDVITHDGMSDRLHDSTIGSGMPTNTTACTLYSALKKRGSPASCAPFAFLLGYVSHTVADVIVHPIVNVVAQNDSMRHRHCETCQDALLYNDYKGGNIKHEDYLSWLTLCNERSYELYATIDLWHGILLSSYGDYNCRWWVKSYETGFSIARQVIHIDGWSYPSPAQIHEDELKMFYSEVVLPLDMGTGHFEKRVFRKAVGFTAQLWQQIYRRYVDPADDRGIADLIPNWNLNTGENITTKTTFDLWR